MKDMKTARNPRRTRPRLAVPICAGLAVLLVVFLWGQVQINFILLKNDALIEERKRVGKEVDELCSEIHTLRSAQRIAQLASRRGLEAASALQVQELPVDARGIRIESRPDDKAAFADLVPIRALLPKSDATHHRKNNAIPNRP
jgi:hypothetical protein